MSTQPTKFRKKPVTVEAMCVLAYTEMLPPAEWNGHVGGAVWRWMHDCGSKLHVEQAGYGPVYGIIPTLEGPMKVSVGDWIIRGVQGEFYPCKPDIFRATYEEAE